MMSRASYGAHEGTYYYEVEIPQHKGNLRIGFATEKADQQAPVGYDCYGYSIRDKDGMIFHQSRGNTYGKPYSILIILYSSL